MVNCSFNAVHERDMDILFMESLASDPNFTTLVLSKTKYSGKEFQVLSTALSETETNLEKLIFALFYKSKIDE